MKNAVNRDIPDELLQNGRKPFMGSGYYDGTEYQRDAPVVKHREKPFESKVLPSIRDAVLQCGVKDGMTFSFHHHFREGDYIINMVMKEIVGLGVRDIPSPHSVGSLMIPSPNTLSGASSRAFRPAASAAGWEAVSNGKLKTPDALRRRADMARRKDRRPSTRKLSFTLTL